MAKVYGGRWQLTDGKELGHGGQATVFRVRDLTRQYTEEAALKRVLNPKRRARFLTEIDAIKRLTDPETQRAHPNIISLIDHSALDESASADAQYLVMPIAHGGDLGDPRRLALYKEFDGALQVAKQIAIALRAAHAAKIIHRDIKPENILFTGNGHDLWVSDFGICLISEGPRVTETSEMVGPRLFMAPELEEGGQLDVSSSVDLYSLGKVIYFMLSGGVILPREHIHKDQYRSIFEKSGRYALMEVLLRRMICDDRDRLQNADDVIGELDKIERWEERARILPVSNSALAGFDEIKRRSLETGRIAAENASTRTKEQQRLASVQTTLTDWLRATLRQLAQMIESSTIKCTVEDAAIPDAKTFRVQTGPTSGYRALNGVQISVEDSNDQTGRIHTLKFFLCRHQRVVVLIAEPKGLPKVEPEKETELALLPQYSQTLRHVRSNQVFNAGYLSRRETIGTARTRLLPASGTRGRSQVNRYRVERIMGMFERDVSIHTEFRASEWPGNEEDISDMVSAAIDVFAEILKH